MMKTYTIEMVQGYSGYDHLAPLQIDGRHNNLTAARAALERGRVLQGTCAKMSRQVRCDIVRSDGKRFIWQ